MNLPNAARAFLQEDILSCESFGSGHINRTYMLTTASGRYVLQRINEQVFRDPVALMENAAAVTDFIRKKGGIALRFLKSAQGACYQDTDGFWRAYEFVDGLCLNAAQSPEDLYHSGLAFGQFQHSLSDFPAATLHETIPDFHNTPVRFAQLRDAVQANFQNRLATCRQELEQALSYEALGGRLMTLLEAGQLPLRVTHNDTKLNNVLLDPATRQPLCVLDLDTVMPGLSAFDFGDAIRFGACTAAEDEQDASKMKLDITLFEAFTRGFLEGAPSLTEAERQVLPLGAFTMTLECGIRFLADYLKGDTYFRTEYPTHNLVRARTQLALCADMLARWDDMTATVEGLK